MDNCDQKIPCVAQLSLTREVLFCFLSLLIRKMLNYIETSVYDNYVEYDNVLMFVHRILMGLN